jgi:hypothetical protein
VTWPTLFQNGTSPCPPLCILLHLPIPGLGEGWLPGPPLPNSDGTATRSELLATTHPSSRLPHSWGWWLTIQAGKGAAYPTQNYCPHPLHPLLRLPSTWGSRRFDQTAWGPAQLPTCLPPPPKVVEQMKEGLSTSSVPTEVMTLYGRCMLCGLWVCVSVNHFADC